MQMHMNFYQYSALSQQIMLGQTAQTNLMATNLLLQNIRMNWLLTNEEAELGINANSEDLDAEEDDG